MPLNGALVFKVSYLAMSQKDLFIKVWIIIFKPLFAVMVGVLIFRTALMVYHDGFGFLKFANVALGLGIATIGIAVVAGIIACVGLKYKKN